MERISGVLLHISSLPGPGGIGGLGKEARQFADFLHQSGMHVWQVLPMGPTGYGESPYQSPSTFAGSPLLISLETLRSEGLVDYTDAELSVPEDPGHVDFPTVRREHEAILRRCYESSYASLLPQIDAFRQRSPWVDDYALFAALKAHFHDVIWTQWPDRDIRLRRRAAVEAYRGKLREEVQFHVFCQFLFERQWMALKSYCNHLDIQLFGDMPIYVAEDSADTWVYPRVFQLDRNRIPRRIAGVPPDYFSEDGQKWGNPLYNWTYLRLTGYRWWIARMEHMLRLYDMVRVDHFIGFANYYSIPYGAPNARVGKWVRSPGFSFFRTLKRRLPGARIIAEDLGSVNDRVRRLIDYTGYPGMYVLVFGFGGKPEENHHFPSHWTENAIGYTGTHDNDTVLGYLRRADASELALARRTLGFDRVEDGPEAFVRSVLSSPCRLAVLPMQDVLGLDNGARMNLPGTVGGNWTYRMLETDLTDSLAGHLRQLNLECGRNG